VSENYFDERIAATYEAKWPELFEPAVVDPAVSFLADLARSGTALELGIGTGRLALPLSRRGIRVHGIELSPAMAARLRAEPGADGIGVTIGDFATATVSGRFGLAYLVRNTIMNLTTQDGQVACFCNVADHLEPDGCFVIEVIVPELQRLPLGGDRPGVHRHPAASRLRRVRHRRAGRHLAPLLGGERRARDLLGAVPLRLALRAGPHGPARRDDFAGALE
jgi:SAM-dependent methyltransferase